MKTKKQRLEQQLKNAIKAGNKSKAAWAIVEIERLEIQEEMSKDLQWEKVMSDTYQALIYFSNNTTYGLTIIKERSKWLIFGEDHGFEDYDENLDSQGKIVGFTSLKKAKKAAENIKEIMQSCVEDCLLA